MQRAMTFDDPIIGIDIGGTRLRIGAVDQSLEVRNFEIDSTSSVLDSIDVVDSLGDYIKDYCHRHDVCPLAVAIGVPGTVSADRRRVISAGNVPRLNGLPLVESLESYLNLPVFLNRDTNMHLVHDMRDIQNASDKTIVGCYPGTGFGSALWIDGRLHVGLSGSEGELGHIPVIGNRRVCACGNTGCIETIASGKFLEEIVSHYHGVPISKAFVMLRDEQPVLDFIDNLAIAVATVVNILDPHVVLLGGGVVNMANFPKQLLIDNVLERTRKPVPARSVEFQFTKPGHSNAVVGAAMYGRNELRNNDHSYRKRSYVG